MRLHRLTGLEQEKLSDEYRQILETIRGLIEILENPDVLLEVIRDELRSGQGRVRRCAPHRDPALAGRPQHARPDRAGRRGGDAVAYRLRQAPAGQHLSRAASWRQGPLGLGAEGRGFRRAAVGGQHPRHAADLHQHRPRLLAARSTRCPRPARMRAASRSSTCCRWSEGEKVQAVLPVREYARRPLRVLRHPQRHGQEDAADRVRLPAAEGQASRSTWTRATRWSTWR